MTMTINLNVLVNNEVERQTAIRLAKAVESTLQQALIENGDMSPGVTSTGVVLINEIVKTEKARSINIGATFGSERSRTEISAWATTHMDTRPLFDVDGTYRNTSEPVKFTIHAADEAEAHRYLEGRGESHGLLAYRLTQRDTRPLFEVQATYKDGIKHTFTLHAVNDAEVDKYVEEMVGNDMASYVVTQITGTKPPLFPVAPLPDLKALLHKQPSGSVLGVLKTHEVDGALGPVPGHALNCALNYDEAIPKVCDCKAKACPSCGVAEGGRHKLECTLNPARQYPYPRQG